jgi:hypothetical protein
VKTRFQGLLSKCKVYCYGAANAGEDNNCVAGGACYRTAWMLNAVLVVAAVALCSYLAQRRARRAPPNALSRIS